MVVIWVPSLGIGQNKSIFPAGRLFEVDILRPADLNITHLIDIIYGAQEPDCCGGEFMAQNCQIRIQRPTMGGFADNCVSSSAGAWCGMLESRRERRIATTHSERGTGI